MDIYPNSSIFHNSIAKIVCSVIGKDSDTATIDKVIFMLVSSLAKILFCCFFMRQSKKTHKLDFKRNN